MSRRFAKVLCFLVIPLFLFTTPTTTYAAASDISGHWAEETLIKWVGQGWLTGNGEGTFSPNKSVTRAEFVALVNRMKGYKGDADISNFTDVTPDKWYYKDIKAAISAGYLAGTGPRSISPEKTITRQEAIAIVSRIEGVSGSDASALSYATDGNSVAGWAQKSVAACINVGYVTGSEGKINPLSNITKAEAIVLLNNVNTKTRSFALAGTFGPTSGKLSASKVNVLAAGVNLRNVAVSGDFVIDKAVGNGDVRLDAVDVNGTLLVEGGGLNSIYVNNCKIGKLDVTKNECRVDVDEGSSVTNAIARGWNSIIEFRSGVTVDNLTVIGRDNRITLSSTAVIDAIEVRGANTKIETEAGSLIKLITVDASTKIVGNGTILVANVSADLTTEKKPDTVNIKGNGEVIIGSSTASPVYSTPIPPSGGGGGGGSYYPTSTPMPEEPSPTDEPEPSPSDEPSPSPSPSPSPEATPTITATPSPTATATPTPTATNSPTPTPIQIKSVLELANALKDTSTTASSLELNLLKEFYDDANNAGSYIEINEGTKPVEIHGSSTEELTVGVWVQRDDLTLDKLNFNITDSDKATKAYWTDSSNYYNAILLGKGPTSPYHNGAGLKNVTVTNSTINISGFTFTSGIYVGGVYDSRPDNVEISRNTIIAKGNEKSAVQGLLINVFDKSLIIKNNYISSTYGNGTPPIPYNAPASAFFISTLFDEATTNSSLNISDNTLSCAQYTFYINVLPEDNVVTSAGVKAMREKEFGLPSTKWSFEPAESFAKVVFDNLVGQVDDIGFAFVSEFVKRAPEFEVEQYEIDSKAVVGISYYGDKLVDGHYDNSAWYKGHVVPYGTPNAETDPNGAVHFKHSNPNPNGNTTYPVPSSSTRSFRPRSTTPRVTTPRAKSRRSKVPQTHLESFYR